MESTILDYIAKLLIGNGLIIAAGAYVLGLLVKQSLPFVPNRYIPLIGGVMGLLAGVLAPGIFPGADWFTAAVQGMALGWAATGGYEAMRNLTGKA